MRQDGKIARTVYTGSGVKSVEWIDPPKKAPKAESRVVDLKTEKTKKD